MFKKYLLLIFLTLNTLFAQQIAKISEASGICFHPVTKTLFVVGDEGYIYELTTDGKILREVYLDDYDLEGITYNPSTNELLLVNERSNSLLVVSVKDFKVIKTINIKKKYKKIKILHKESEYYYFAKDGIEGITLHNSEIFLSHQSNKLLPEKHPSVIFTIAQKNKNKKAKIKNLYDYRYIDISGLCSHQGYLYMVSDKTDLLVKIDLVNNKVLQELHIPGSDQEGVCFDDSGNIYFADDSGYILKFNAKELGVQ